MEKICYVVIMSARKLRYYFQAHAIKVLTNQPLNDIFGNRDISGNIRPLACSTCPFVHEWVTAAQSTGCFYHHRNQIIFPTELSVIVGDDGVRDPETEDDVLHEIYYLFGSNLSQVLCLDPLSKLVDRIE
jgi:hypothetical protein